MSPLSSTPAPTTQIPIRHVPRTIAPFHRRFGESSEAIRKFGGVSVLAPDRPTRAPASPRGLDLPGPARRITIEPLRTEIPGPVPTPPMPEPTPDPVQDPIPDPAPSPEPTPDPEPPVPTPDPVPDPVRDPEPPAPEPTPDPPIPDTDPEPVVAHASVAAASRA